MTTLQYRAKIRAWQQTGGRVQTTARQPGLRVGGDWDPEGIPGLKQQLHVLRHWGTSLHPWSQLLTLRLAEKWGTQARPGPEAVPTHQGGQCSWGGRPLGCLQMLLFLALWALVPCLVLLTLYFLSSAGGKSGGNKKNDGVKVRPQEPTRACYCPQA